MNYKNENGEWKEVILPPSGDTLPIGSIVEIPDDMEVPYGYELVEDEWINAELKTGVTAITMGGSSVPQFKKEGNKVSIRGAVQITWDGIHNTVLFNLPVGYRPSNNVFVYAVSAEKSISRLYVSSNGDVIIDSIIKLLDGSNRVTETWVDIHLNFELQED